MAVGCLQTSSAQSYYPQLNDTAGTDLAGTGDCVLLVTTGDFDRFVVVEAGCSGEVMDGNLTDRMSFFCFSASIISALKHTTSHQFTMGTITLGDPNIGPHFPKTSRPSISGTIL